MNGLKAFLNDGCIEIDNNPAENVIRPNVIGRNYVFKDIKGKIGYFLLAKLGLYRLFTNKEFVDGVGSYDVDLATAKYLNSVRKVIAML